MTSASKRCQLTLIRHAESFYNVEKAKLLEGKEATTETLNDIEKILWQKKELLDCGITNKGIQQASNLNLNFDFLICSPLQRCLQTLKYSQITFCSFFL